MKTYWINVYSNTDGNQWLGHHWPEPFNPDVHHVKFLYRLKVTLKEQVPKYDERMLLVYPVMKF